MTNVTNNENIPLTLEEKSKKLEEMDTNSRQLLIEQAKDLGLTFPPNIKTERLKEIVNAKLAQSNLLKPNENIREKNAKIRDEAMALVRFNLIVVNPAKMNWTGEIITVSNDIFPEVRRFIPFRISEVGWHAERIIVEALKERKFQQMYEYTNSSNSVRHIGVDRNKTILLPEFKIIELPQLTEKELKVLIEQQEQDAEFNNN